MNDPLSGPDDTDQFALAGSPVRNRILRSVGARTFERLARELEPVELQSRQELSRAGRHPEFAYFPEGGILSFTLKLAVSGEVEFGIVGREGLSTFSAMWEGQISPVSTFVQIGGVAAHRIESATLRSILADHPDLQTAIQTFLYNFMGQMAFTAVSNARHTLAERLSRWLLLCDDRLDDGEIRLTHEFMAMMLGAQRTSVTSTLHVLEGEGAIRSRRGVVRIVDRDRLQRCAGEAYLDPLKGLAGRI